MKLLVAEDDLTSNLMLREIFEKWGYDVICADNGDDAWAILQKSDAPKIAVLDWVMPGLHGVEICRKIKKQKEPNPPYLIILTGKACKEDIVEGLESGGDDYITKPFDENELRARIRVAVRMVEIQENLNQNVNELRKAMDEIKVLKGLLPICSNCKKIRDDEGHWEIWESYIQKNSEALFSHGICPECTEELYGKENWYIKMYKDKKKED